MGNISIVISVAPAIGPTISGLILNYLDWRWMFILVLPIALGALALGAARIRNVTTPRYAPLDILSVILSALAFGGIVFGLIELGAPSADASAIPGWVPLAIGVVSMAAFIWRQLDLGRRGRALLDLGTFRSRNFSVAVLMMAIAMMSLFGTVILLPIYLQNVLGIDTLQTGLLLLPGGLVMGVLAPPVGRLYDRVGTTRLLVPGSIIVSAVMWALTLVDQNTSVWAVLAGHVTISIGLSLVFTPLFTASLSSVTEDLYAHASAILGSIQQVAGAAGVALFVALMSLNAASLSAAGADPVSALAGGIRTGFLCGAIFSVFMVVAAFFVRKPEGSSPHGGAH
jgi:DHA2 family lincomycin resistance protein-like MFS transporter